MSRAQHISLSARSAQKRFSGFTLIEVLVSVTIFAAVVTLVLSLFNYTLKIYRRVEAQRQVAQSLRTTMEFVVKEVRNGRVDYGIVNGLTPDVEIDSHCPIPASGAVATYSTSQTNYLGLVNVDGERECLYWIHDSDPDKQNDAANNNLFIKKQGVALPSRLNPANVKFLAIKFLVRPLRDPYAASPYLEEVQPSVSLVALASIRLGTGEVRIVPYQTTISTYIYDIPSQ